MLCCDGISSRYDGCSDDFVCWGLSDNGTILMMILSDDDDLSFDDLIYDDLGDDEFILINVIMFMCYSFVIEAL